MILPTQDYRQTHLTVPPKLPKGLDAIAHGLAGCFRRRKGNGHAYKYKADKISGDATNFKHLSDRRLKNRLADVRDIFRRQAHGFDSALPQALALLVEVADRTLHKRPYPVQIMGALAMYDGCLVEMATGEGKSLTACLPAVLAAWTGRPFHFVTVNDYLSARDADEMQPFYSFCGVSVGCTTGEMDQQTRRENYTKGVVYTTAKELVADLLRDQLVLGTMQNHTRRLLRELLNPELGRKRRTVLSGLDTVIVDEADSVLIDEAVTPLIISRSKDNQPLLDACQVSYDIASCLKAGEDYTTDRKYREVTINEAGFKKIEDHAAQLHGMWRGSERRAELVKQALTAREFYRRDQQYVIQDDKVAIVDEFTGRLMPDRTWRHGLHQAVEAKERLSVSAPSETLARMSFQRFLRLFRKISGMTGTASEAAGELWQIYNLPVLKIPTHKPDIREIQPDRVFATVEEKWKTMVQEIETYQQTGRPILIGTRSVKASERLAAMLRERGMEFNLLNAVRHTKEARIVAAAGELNRITISTNMAGRGTDIKLGRGVAEKGGLHVIASERHESGRIDRQLFGRCARQGDPGTARAFMSVEDELFKRFVPKTIRKQLTAALRRRRPGAKHIAEKALRHAQRTAQRHAYRQRKNVYAMDTWLESALSFTGSNKVF